MRFGVPQGLKHDAVTPSSLRGYTLKNIRRSFGNVKYHYFLKGWMWFTACAL